MIIEFSSDDSNLAVYVPIAHAWQENPDSDLHIQFRQVGTDNFMPTYNEVTCRYQVPYKGKTLAFRTLSFLKKPSKGSKRLKISELEDCWISPNRS